MKIPKGIEEKPDWSRPQDTKDDPLSSFWLVDLRLAMEKLAT